MGLTLLRIARYPANVVADFEHHGRAVGFFTVVAATAVLGSQTLVIGGAWQAAAGLWRRRLPCGRVLTYAIFTILTVKADKPALAEGINGGWLVARGRGPVGRGARRAARRRIRRTRGSVLLFCLVMWLGGGMLYIWIISLIFYRYTFFTMSPSDLAPPYWINMGAVAISTLAGSAARRGRAASPLLTELLPFLKGFTLLFWSTATWWIPMLVILGVWRHIYRRFPLRYDPLYWGAVFPLGMYTVCTYRLAEGIEVPWLLAIPRVPVYVALAAWLAALAGLVWTLARAPGLLARSRRA